MKPNLNLTATYPCIQHAHILELLSAHLKEGCRALDVGSGSGYLTACMARMVSDCIMENRLNYLKVNN